ncbi:MAG: hypothetical protein ACTHM1_07020 [Solirubrobacteraceae bacterium]
MDQEVAQTLAALERKLSELERELGRVNQDGIDSHDSSPGPAAAPSPLPDLAAAPEPPSSVETRAASGPAPSAGILIDEAVERRYSMEARETVFGEIPATKDERQSIDLADLVRFKAKMQATLQGLIDEYSELLSLKPPTDA